MKHYSTSHAPAAALQPVPPPKTFGLAEHQAHIQCYAQAFIDGSQSMSIALRVAEEFIRTYYFLNGRKLMNEGEK